MDVSRRYCYLVKLKDDNGFKWCHIAGASDIGRCCKFGYKAKGIYFSYDSNFIINKNCKKLKEQ